MTENKNQAGAENVPLGLVYRLKDLPGWLGKRLPVPLGRLGVVIYRDGSSRTFPPGEHPLLSAVERLRAKGYGLKAGYVPGAEFPASAQCAYLLSGDGELLDARLVCALQVSDPLRFFKEVVIPRGALPQTGFALEPQPLQDALGALTVQYAAADLLSGQINARLAQQLQASLGALLGSQGLSLQEIRLLILSRAADRALIAEKIQALAERLKDVELQAKMAEIENQVQLDEFIQQLAPELQQVIRQGVVMDQSGQPKSSIIGKLGGTVRGWLGMETKKGQKQRSWLEELFNRRQAAAPKIRRPPARWWLPRAIWIIFITGLGFLFSWLAEWLAPGANSGDRMGLHFLIWGFAISGILESIKALYEKGEKIEEETWMLPGYQQIDKLVGNDRLWADELVREQCARELEHVCELVSEIRSIEYKRGKTELALKLRNEIERNATGCMEKVQRRDYGQPPYVTDLRVSQKAWLHMLDLDEDLLLYAHAVSDKANLLQQKSHAGELSESLLTDLDADISKFCNRFFERGRPLHVPDDAATA